MAERSRSPANIRTEIKTESKEAPGEGVAEGRSEVKDPGTSMKLEEYPSEDQAESSAKKPRKQFLKRKTKKVESKKVEWKVGRKIDCWNPRPKDSDPHEAEKKVMLQRSKGPAKPRRSARRSVSKENYSMEEGRRSQQRRRNYPVLSLPTQEEEAAKMTVEELTDVYLLYHGNNEGTVLAITMGNSGRDVLRAQCGRISHPCDAAASRILPRIQ